MTFVHIPVLLKQVIRYLNPQPHHRILDATFGAGGYSKAIWTQMGGVGELLMSDRDPLAYSAALTWIQNDQNGETSMERSKEGVISERVAWHTAFSKLPDLLRERYPNHDVKDGILDGLVCDLGVSSMQLDNPDRGFSYRRNGPLDMRMDTGNGQPSDLDVTAMDLVNTLPPNALEDILHQYGEEKFAKRIAQAIATERNRNLITTTKQLSEIVFKSVPRVKNAGQDSMKHPAMRTFQALRIAVNNEEVEAILDMAKWALKPGGRLVIVSFHSLEDRIVKQFLKQHTHEFTLLNKKAEKPDQEELTHNPRSRSAKLRAAVRALHE